MQSVIAWLNAHWKIILALLAALGIGGGASTWWPWGGGDTPAAIKLDPVKAEVADPGDLFVVVAQAPAKAAVRWSADRGVQRLKLEGLPPNVFVGRAAKAGGFSVKAQTIHRGEILEEVAEVVCTGGEAEPDEPAPPTPKPPGPKPPAPRPDDGAGLTGLAKVAYDAAAAVVDPHKAANAKALAEELAALAGDGGRSGRLSELTNATAVHQEIAVVFDRTLGDAVQAWLPVKNKIVAASKGELGPSSGPAQWSAAIRAVSKGLEKVR